LLPHLLQHLDAPDQGLQLLQLRSGWGPDRGLFLGTAVRNERGIRLVCLGRGQAALGISGDAGGIDDADLLASLRQGQRQRCPVLPSRLQAGVDLLKPVLVDPPV